MSEQSEQAAKPVRHIISLSGGKDSTALAIYMRDRLEQAEYVFCDTGKELRETYDYLQRLETYLGKQITHLTHSPDAFDDLLAVRNNFLPSPQMRWCTELLKIRPFERFVGDDTVVSYIGLRADEDRKGYISSKPNIQPRYPFREDGLGKEDVARILNESGLGFPDYYKWRSRSGCYFCFFQQRIEWVGLLENHPDLYQQAMTYEKYDPVTGRKYTWVSRESLADLANPERVARIKEQHQRKLREAQRSRPDTTLAEILSDEDEAQGSRACLICEL